MLKNKGTYKSMVQQGFEYDASVAKYFTPEGAFILTKGARIAQIIPQIGVVVFSQTVKAHEELGFTNRGAGGFGSTGLTG